MSHKTRFFIFLALAIACLLAACAVTLRQIDAYKSAQALYPPGTTLGTIPIGGLDAQAAGERLSQVYLQTPLELRIQGSVIHVNPLDAGLQFNLEGILYIPSQIMAQRSFWAGFWDFLWNRPSSAVQSPLPCTVSVEQLRAYLKDTIAPRYEQPPTPAAAKTPGDVLFSPGQPGYTLDFATAEPAIQAALCSPSQRSVEIIETQSGALPPSTEQLNLVLQSITQAMDFDGAIELYYQDLTSGKEVNFAYNQGHAIEPGIAFTGASTIKIPVMVSAYKKIDGALPDELRHRMELMIDLSDNGSTDEVMKSVLDENIAPVQVTEDAQALGLQNTFLAGFFYPGAPLLNAYKTPANQRTDISTDPDMYNQTTAADMGRLLAAIQRCSTGTGPLIETFQGKVSQAECQEMTDLLSKNRKGVLIEAGVPEGTRMAHKYGWVTDSNDGLLHTTSDAAIVYTPGGDFILTVYLYQSDQLQWDPAQLLVARLATAIYNFHNGWK